MTAASVLAVSADPAQARTRFRSEHNVELVSLKDEGSALAFLPAGVYGFSYAPGTETPLFARHSYHSYEVHKLADGSARLIAFCSAEDAERMRTGGSVVIYPDPVDSGMVAVSLPFEWIATDMYRPVRKDGNAIAIRVEPD